MTTSHGDAVTDLLDYVFDNRADSRRELYRNGEIVAMCDSRCSHPYLKVFGAQEPFGSYPDAAPKEQV